MPNKKGENYDDSFLLVSKFPAFQMPAEDRVEEIFQEQLEKCYEVIRKHGKQVIVMEPVKGGASDVTEALKEAVKTQAENSFQSYMD